MRIGLTGATGFVGSHFTRLACQPGEVVAYSRGSRLPEGAASVLRQPADAPHALPETRLDALVHLAGESLMGLWTPAKRERIWRSRVDFTEGLVRQLSNWRPENRPRVLVCASGAGYYGNRGDLPVDESTPQGEGFLAELCGRWEAAARAAESLGLRVVNLRTGMVLGARGGALPLLRRVFGLGLGGRLGSGRQWLSWIHADDAARLIRRAVEDERLKGPLNLCAPGAVTNADFTRGLAAALHRPAFCHAPDFALRLILRDLAGEMLLAGQRVVPQAALDAGYRFAFPTLETALADLLGLPSSGSAG
jgi:uncharacterized protein (TIGR01777 family)